MRFVLTLILFLVVINWIILILNGALGINLYKKYGMSLLKGFFVFLLLVAAIYVAFSLLALGT